MLLNQYNVIYNNTILYYIIITTIVKHIYIPNNNIYYDFLQTKR